MWPQWGKEAVVQSLGSESLCLCHFAALRQIQMPNGLEVAIPASQTRLVMTKS